MFHLCNSSSSLQDSSSRFITGGNGNNTICCLRSSNTTLCLGNRYRANGSVMKVVCNIVMSYVGAGILGIPYGFKHSGLIAGTCILSLVCGFSIAAANLLIECKAKAANLLHKSAGGSSGQESLTEKITHSDIASAAFGPTGRVVMDVALSTAQLGFSSAYLLFICNSMVSIFPAQAKQDFLIMFLFPLFALTLIRDLNKFAIFSFLSQVANFIAFSIIICFAFGRFQVDHDNPETQDVQVTFQGLFLFFSISIYSYEGSGLILSLEESVPESARSRFRGYFASSLVTITAFYITFGALGFMAYGSNSAEMITSNLVRDPESYIDFGMVVKLCLCFSLFFSYPLMLFPLSGMLEERFPKSTLTSILIRFGLVLSTAIIIVLFPSFADLLEIIGSVCCSMVAFVMPALCHLKFFSFELNEKQKMLNLSLILVGGTAMTLGVGNLCAKLVI